MNIDSSHQQTLLDVARTSILEGMPGGAPCPAGRGAWPAPLAEHGASFVTLTVDGVLRGCIGTIEPHRPLVEDVRSNARRTAFEDPRFTPFAAVNLRAAAIEISVLTPLESIAPQSEEALLAMLRPGVDGLLISFGHLRATFLPKVWDMLPEPPVFLRHLKQKMGVAPDFWHEAVELSRYRTQEFGGPLAPPAARDSRTAATSA